jgi:vancomycin resistance protein YoaR
MHQNISKSKNLKTVLSLAAAFLVLAGSKSVVAAENIAPQAAFTLKTVDQTFDISEDSLNTWKTPQNSSHKIAYVFGPETDLKTFTRITLGAESEARSHLHFENYNVAAIYSYLRTLRPGIDTDAQDSILELNNEGRVSNFNPGLTGKTLDIPSSINSIVEAISEGQNETTLSISETQPNKALADTNNLGVKELIAVGTSNFAGSPSNRIHNIKVGVQKETGILIAPGEEYSFNKFLGEVDGEHGFLPELVIKKTGTVPEFGGGLCQVSSTVFRAAMNAGLPITERRNHSYAVQYYAPQGTDATIYPGVVDLKFKNNTSGYLLIWPTFPSKNELQFSIYGTKDSRQIAVGTPYQYDRKSNGAMKATWTRTVTMPDGETWNDEFKSVYQPPALFHKVETFPPKPEEPKPIEQTPSAPTSPIS